METRPQQLILWESDMGQASFRLDQLEGRALFSVGAPVAAGAVTATSAAVMVPAVRTTTPLSGTFNVAGKWNQPLGNPDTGTHYLFNGTGNKKSLGNFTLTGDITGPGLIANGHASGYLTITTPKGKIILKVQGPPQTPGSLPPSLFYRIVNGTGSYAHAAGKGHATVSASSATHKFLFRFNPTT
jgi:hypothetical protein